MSVDIVKSAKTKRLNARSIGCKVRNIFVALLLSFLGSAAIVFAADYFMFRNGTWHGWTMVARYPSDSDVAWWKSQIGPLPTPTSSEGMVMPGQSRGRTGLTSGSDSITASRLPEGIISVDMITESKWISGGVLTSKTKHAWHLGVDFPGGKAFERVYIGTPGVAPAHPTYGGWEFRVLPMGLALNSLFVAGPFFVLITILAWIISRLFHRILVSKRRASGRCEVCAYVLIAGQNPCPECGNHRLVIEHNAANCGNKLS